MIEAYIWKDVANDHKILFIERIDRRQSLYYNPLTQQTHPRKEGEPVKEEFVLKLPYDAFQSLANAISSLGVKTENEHKIEGELKATKLHLEDMRKLVFKT